MKPHLSLLPVLALIALATVSLTGLRAEEKAKASSGAIQVSVPKMTCEGCAFGITQELKKLDEVTEVYVDADAKVAVIEAKSKKAPGKEAILAAIKKAGYDGEGYKQLKVPFSQAKADLEKKEG